MRDDVSLQWIYASLSYKEGTGDTQWRNPPHFGISRTLLIETSETLDRVQRYCMALFELCFAALERTALSGKDAFTTNFAWLQCPGYLYQ